MPILIFLSSSRPKQNTTGCDERRAVMENDGRQPIAIGPFLMMQRYTRRVENTPAFGFEGVGSVGLCRWRGSGVITWYPALFSSRTILTKRARCPLALTAGPRSS